MPVCHVAQFVTKYGGHFDGTQRINQGVGEQNVTKVGEDSGHASVDHEMPRVPDQKVIEPEADPARDALQAIAKGPAGKLRVGQARRMNSGETASTRRPRTASSIGSAAGV